MAVPLVAGLLSAIRRSSPADALPHVLGGSDDLEVVGESFYQENLRRITGPGKVRVAVTAVLVAETDNHYDPNAISVWISQLAVGHLGRDDARRYRPGLLALMERYSAPIALRGVAVGEQAIGVFLRHDPRDFGILLQPTPIPHSGTIRTGLSEAIATDEADDSYDLSWLETLPYETAARIARLRDLLAGEHDPLDRHFMFSELEAAIYRVRNAMPDVLAEFDAVCRDHDSEMDTLRPAFLKKWGAVPWLPTYRQMCIRKQKQGDWTTALWWAERGLAVYANEAARPEAVRDLITRAESCRVQIRGSLPKEHDPRPSSPPAVGLVVVETLSCRSCGESFDRVRSRGRKPLVCPGCRGSQIREATIRG
ncbi:MAG TPA: hypothetical protein VI056_07780 [Candidatus Limnocylindria bacterium]